MENRGKSFKVRIPPKVLEKLEQSAREHNTSVELVIKKILKAGLLLLEAEDNPKMSIILEKDDEQNILVLFDKVE